MSYLDEPLRIISLRLTKESLKTHRVLNDGNPDLYPVIVGFNRPVDEYERLCLKDFGVIGNDKNEHWARIDDTNLETIRDNIEEFHASLDSAVEEARKIRVEAEAEDERICELAKTVLYRLRRDHGLDAPAE